MSEEVAEVVEVSEPSTEIEQSETPNEEAPSSEEPEQQEGESNVDYEQRLKTADNLIRKLKFQRKNEQRQRAEDKKKLAEAQKELAQFKAPKEPNEDDFESAFDYMKALAKFHAEQGRPQQSEQQETPEQIEQRIRAEMHTQQRLETVREQARELSTKIPDYVQVHMNNVDILEELPPHASQAIQEADNGALAFYTLAKTGQLEQLASMNPLQAAYAIARAEADGQKYLNKPTTQAPAPMKGVKGTTSVQSEDTLSGKQLLKKHGL